MPLSPRLSDVTAPGPLLRINSLFLLKRSLADLDPALSDERPGLSSALYSTALAVSAKRRNSPLNCCHLFPLIQTETQSPRLSQQDPGAALAVSAKRRNSLLNCCHLFPLIQTETQPAEPRRPSPSPTSLLPLLSALVTQGARGSWNRATAQALGSRASLTSFSPVFTITPLETLSLNTQYGKEPFSPPFSPVVLYSRHHLTCMY
ncbi:hypothetical protein TREES_T100010521 [Tupaia chinensis]|uniref:Uncharacterized protein n=1 Tax=Tupaia chinensis TaxID=246437 RepID=L9LAM4_TUPCH|nr:hypothetical protein TREES_T100010521 [Tupaia chinensis]